METSVKSIRIKFDKLQGETAKAVLLLIGNKQHWFPRKFCWNFILNNKLGGNMVIPTWLYEEKFGVKTSDCEDLPFGDADTIIEKHVPAKVEPIKPKADAELTR